MGSPGGLFLTSLEANPLNSGHIALASSKVILEPVLCSLAGAATPSASESETTSTADPVPESSSGWSLVESASSSWVGLEDSSVSILISSAMLAMMVSLESTMSPSGSSMS